MIGINVNCEIVPFDELFPGDTFNLNDLTLTSVNVRGSIFNSYSDGVDFIDNIGKKFNLKPGDVIDQNYLKELKPENTTDNLYHSTSVPLTLFDYTNCYQYNNNQLVKLEYDYKNSYGKLNLFQEMVERKNYGVDHKYLNKNYKCPKITLFTISRTKITRHAIIFKSY